MTLTLRVQRCAWVAVLCGFFSPVTTRAHDTPTQIEIGGQAGVSDLTYGGHTPGFGGWLDVNLSKQVALETRVTWSPDSRYDRTLHVAGGLRATFVRAPRFAWYGLALPGLYHFAPYCLTAMTGSSGPNPPPPTSVTTCARQTHFALDLGSGLAFAPTSHVVTRIELNRVIHSSPYEDLVGPGRFVSRWDLNAGVSYRLGPTLKPPQSALPAVGRWTVGSQIGETLSTGPTVVATLGAFASYALCKYCDIDASVSSSLGDQLRPTEHEGGRLLQGLAGMKIGVREGRMGVFFKARAGVNSYSRVFTGFSEAWLMYSRSTVPALDLGGVVETYLSARTLLRIDVGETLSYAPSVSIALPRDLGTDRYPARALYSLPLRLGFGWRF